MSIEVEPVGYMVANHPEGPWSFRKRKGSGWFCEREVYSEDQVRQLAEQRAALLEACKLLVYWYGKRLSASVSAVPVDDMLPLEEQEPEVQIAMRAIALAQGDAA